MAESISEPEKMATHVTQLYSQESARFRFRAIGEFEESLRKMFAPESQMGQKALFLYSDAQAFHYREYGEPDNAIERLGAAVTRRIASLEIKTYQLAKWVKPVLEEDRTAFQFNVLLNPAIQEQLHACQPEGLSMSKFGRKALEATLWVPNTEIVDKPGRLLASRSIREALWGGDDPETGPARLQAPTTRPAQVADIEWVSTRI